MFRHGDARTVLGFVPLSRFIADASGSVFSHTGIIAIEDGGPVVYDCSSWGIQRQPLSVWMLDSIGSFGVKRLKPHLSRHTAGVLGFCRKVFEKQVPFDDEFRMGDSKLYCVEMTEKAFRSQGLPLSEPVRIGDWENLGQYPLTGSHSSTARGSYWKTESHSSSRSICRETRDKGSGPHRSWRRCTPKKRNRRATLPADASGRLSLRGDLAVTAFAVKEISRRMRSSRGG